MDTKQIILSQIPVEDLLSSFREIIKQEIKAEQNQQVAERLLSPAAACEVFEPKISKVTLASWTNSSRIPVQRIGGRLYYKHSDLIAAAKTIVKYKKL